MTERTRSRTRAAEMRFLRAVAVVSKIDRTRWASRRASASPHREIHARMVLRVSPTRLVKQVLSECSGGKRLRGRPRQEREGVSRVSTGNPG
ncbi:UNVERIFIED_CONTAM: hypothetical protein PYX00_006782 [Menopon gallinae]|uniref:Uncharacterized protein n=1 Tax=Menopon gallinae TaxID=328185 RepID=A0AAW2HWD1_9NEOP